MELLRYPSGPGPAAVKARTATVYIVAGFKPVISITVLSTPVTVSLIVQSETVEPSW